MKYLSFCLFFPLLLLLPFSLFSQGLAPQEKFQEDKISFQPIFLQKYAILALEEFNYYNGFSKKHLKKNYQIKKAVFSTKNSLDCESNLHPIVWVSFPAKKGNGSANVYILCTSDHYVIRSLERNYTLKTIEAKSEEFHAEGFDYVLWGCDVD